MLFGDGQKQYSYQVSYRKIRGRGPRAPEKLLGADGIFQIEVNDEHGRQTKGLPFQSKKGWRSTDSKLLAQARQMLETAGNGIVIDFRPDRFSACRAEDVVHNHANRRLIDRAGRIRPLGQLLGDDFLDCRIGRPGLFFDPATETWEGGTISPPKVEHLITTGCQSLDSGQLLRVFQPIFLSR